MQRDRIYKMRDALGTFIKSEHYQNALLDYKNNIPFRQEIGKLHASTHLRMLAVYEGMADRDLNLVKDYKPKNDYWLKQIRSSLVSSSSVFKTTSELLDLQIDIAYLENDPGKPINTHLKFGKKFLSLGKKILGAYAAIGSLSQSEFELINKKIFYVSTISKSGKSGPFYKIKNSALSGILKDRKLKKLGKKQYNHRTKTYTYYKVHPDAVEKAKNIAKNSGPGKKPVIYVDKGNSAKYGEQVNKFLNSSGFNKFLLLYEVWGLTVAARNGIKNDWNFNTITSVTGAFVKTSAIVLKLTQDSKVAVIFDNFAEAKKLEVPRLINRYKGKSVAVTYKSTTKFMGAAGSGVTVVMCAKDSYIAFAKADYDAAIAQAVAGVASGILLASQIGLIAGLAFPPAFIISIIGIAAFGIAIYFTDTELEAYFKHYPLSTHSNIKDEFYYLSTYDFMLKLYKHRDELLWPDKDNLFVTESYGHLKDFKRVFIDLMNIISNGNIEIRGSETLHSPHDANSYFDATPKPHKDGWYHPWRSMGVNINFGTFLRSIDDLEFKVYYVMHKTIFKPGYSIPIPKRKFKVLDFYDIDTGLYTAQLWLQIPEKLTIMVEDPKKSIVELAYKTQKTFYLDLEQGNIAVLCKLNGVDGQSLPLTKQGIKGYLYTQLPIQYRDKNTGFQNRRSGFTQVVTNAQFLKTFPLKNNL